jgi:type I restriction enzyme, R subunit
MSTFDEANTIQDMLADSVVLNGWTLMSASMVPEEGNMGLPVVAAWLKESLLLLNKEKGLTGAQADEIVRQIQGVYLGLVNAADLVERNKLLWEKLFIKNSYACGPEDLPTAIDFFDMDDAGGNLCYAVREWTYTARGGVKGNGKRFDLAFFVNGIPMVMCETKTPVRPAISWADGASDILDYEKSVPHVFVGNAFNFATEGKHFRYGGVGAPLEKWGPWYAGCERREGTLEDVKRSFLAMVKPGVVLDIYRNFSLYRPNKKQTGLIKIICRYQQYEGANAIVSRCVEGKVRKGLIWHFQGSGKSYLMLFAAQKLRHEAALKAPTIVIVDDRIDLEEQITADFLGAEIDNVEGAGSKKALVEFFKTQQRKILITTIYKFGEVTDVLDRRENIIVLVDEAHRTQEGDLGAKMRKALPNAFFFGLTGTPVNRYDHNTFNTFGAREDKGGYLSKYSFQDSIEDGATLPLKFQTTPVEMHIDKEELNKEFAALTDQITDEERQYLVTKTNAEALFTAPDRIRKVCEHIVEHYRRQIEPTHMKCQVVVFNRANCVAYKKELDTLLGTDEATAIVMDCNNDKKGEYAQYKLTRDEQNRLLDRFRDRLDPLKFVIVTSKLLTGFDAPILQCMYLDKPMKNHTLLQAICRTNRVFSDEKTHGLIVDYVGIFDDVAKALEFDEKQVAKVIENIDEIKKMLAGLVKDALAFFPGVDRSVGGYEGLRAAQARLDTDQKKDSFAEAFGVLHRAWEILSPDPVLDQYKDDYTWLSQVYESVRKIAISKGLLWKTLGAKTIELIHKNVTRVDIGSTLEELVINSAVLDVAISAADAKKKSEEVMKMLHARLGKHPVTGKFKLIAEKIEELKEKMRLNLETSIGFLKKLLEMAKELLEAEKEVTPEDNRARAKAALTALFESVKAESGKKNLIVENIVNDIDEQVVRVVRNFSDAFESVAGKREVRKLLRSILWIRYQIRDPEVFDKAYSYVEQYY